MQAKHIIVGIAIGLVLLVVFFAAQNLPALHADLRMWEDARKDKVPYTVEEKYQEIEPNYKRPLRAELDRCVSAGKVVYHVYGSTGFVSDEYFLTNVAVCLGLFKTRTFVPLVIKALLSA